MNVMVKWFRKNRMKIMVVFGVVLMVGFIGGASLQQLMERRGGEQKTIATMGTSNVSNYDLGTAQNELAILRAVGAAMMLRSRDMLQTLLGEVIFSERGGADMAANIKQMVRQQGYAVGSKQINDMYRTTAPAHVYWHILKKEAEDAGVAVSNERAAAQLAEIIPQMGEGLTYARYMQMLMQGRGAERGLSEQEVLSAFAKMLGVLDYARMMCSSEAFTTAQLTQMVSAEMERFDVEYVKFDSGVFAKGQAEPETAAMQEQFDKYKNYFIGEVSAENPYGFGYKIPDRVKLEYMAVKLEDVKKVVAAPTREEIQDEYRKRASEFTQQVKADPNDPNSAMVEKRQTYAEVADRLAEQMVQQRVDGMAQRIMQEARGMLEPSFEELGVEPQAATSEHYKQKAKAYADVAKTLSEKHKVAVYTGSTGMLSASDIASDSQLARMAAQGLGYESNPVGLVQLVFAIDEIGATELGPMEAAKPRMYETIGPFKEIYIPTIVMLARVTEARKSAAPDSLEQTFSTATIKLGENAAEDKQYSVKERVTEDVKKLAVLDTVKGRAEEFAALAGKDGFEQATESFNKLYGASLKKDANDPNVFTVEQMPDMGRFTAKAMAVLKAQIAGTPGAEIRLNGAKAQQELTNTLYSLVPEDSNSLKDGPKVVEFKPDLSYLVIKSIVIDRVDQQEYKEAKDMMLYGEEMSGSQALAFVFYNPQNIIERSKWQWVEADEKESADANE